MNDRIMLKGKRRLNSECSVSANTSLSDSISKESLTNNVTEACHENTGLPRNVQLKISKFLMKNNGMTDLQN